MMINGVEVQYSNDVSVVPIRFYTTYKQAVDKNGKEIAGEFVPVDKVDLAKRGTTGHVTPWPISRLMKNEQIWPIVKDAYQKWKEGEAEPTAGTELSACAFLHKEQVDELKRIHVRTVEDLANVVDADFERIGMGARTLRDKARAWLKDKDGSSAVAVALAERDGTIGAQQAEIDELKRIVADLARNDVAKRKPGRPRKAEEQDDPAVNGE